MDYHLRSLWVQILYNLKAPHSPYLSSILIFSNISGGFCLFVFYFIFAGTSIYNQYLHFKVEICKYVVIFVIDIVPLILVNFLLFCPQGTFIDLLMMPQAYLVVFLFFIFTAVYQFIFLNIYIYGSIFYVSVSVVKGRIAGLLTKFINIHLVFVIFQDHY